MAAADHGLESSTARGARSYARVLVTFVFTLALVGGEFALLNGVYHRADPVRRQLLVQTRLAGQTADATKEIGTRIAQIQAATKEAVEAIQGITATIEEVSAIATTIGSAIEEQGAATAEIARNVTQTAQATQEVTTNIGGVSAAAHETGDAAGLVLSAASGLSKQAEQLSGEVTTFLAGVRAA